MAGKLITYNADGTATIEDNRTLDEAIAEAVAQHKARYAAAIAAGMDWHGVPLQIDAAAVQNISAVMLQVVAQVPLAAGFAWRMGDNTYAPMDAAGVAAMATAASARVQELRAAMWASVDAARAATTNAEADATWGSVMQTETALPPAEAAPIVEAPVDPPTA